MQTKNNTQIYHIATSTDANYLPRALVFYRSLVKTGTKFVLHLFCHDDITYHIIKAFNYKNIAAYGTSDFETEDLIKAKGEKDRRYEYYWTCNPAFAKKMLSNSAISKFALADCDMMFFQSPKVIFDELEGSDVIIQTNNFSFPFVKDFVPVGYYCTSFQCFRNCKNAKNIVETWYNQTLEWCSSKFVDGKFGEQKYLDDWKLRYKYVREVANPGTNVAPWNVQKYDLTKKGSEVVIHNKWPLIYYHFHSFRMSFRDYKYIITGDRDNNYPIGKEVLKLVYKPYIIEMKKAIKELKKYRVFRDYINFNPGGDQIKMNCTEKVFDT